MNRSKKHLNKHNKTAKSSHKKSVHSIPNKGIFFSVEQIHVESNIPNLKGDIVKKYKNGKLTKQVFVTEKQIKKIAKEKLQELQKKNSQTHGGTIQIGGINTPHQKTPFAVQNKTGIFDSMKQGFGLGVGLTVAQELVGSVIDSLFDN